MQKTPVQAGLSIPAGHIMVNNRWRNTDLLKLLQSKVSVLFMDSTESVIDFYPSSHSGIIYLTESDILSVSDAKRRVAKLRKSRQIAFHRVLFSKTAMTQQYFAQFQKMVVIDCGMEIFPLMNHREAGDLIIRMIHQDIRTPSRNPFKSRGIVQSSPIDSAILQLVILFPKIGETKAKALLEKFKNINAITKASTEELSSVVGSSSAQHLRKFFET
ncbi:Fanconi anemia core complex-associated protein 24-like [Styela clava]|uniref:Fanconi anemia core complex-associated protein 24-like n=1 Tax=Styela clava TaxID=7725 RepID=UPI00193A49D1|nr:Fanconi anemia core complex-associated protein 24-like [Styela clava]